MTLASVVSAIAVMFTQDNTLVIYINFNFDNRDIYELCQKLFKEEITLEEFKEKAHDLVNDRL